MKRRYGLHPNDFDLGRTEQYYADMAAKGWSLVKRGLNFSRFEKSEPQAMRYRVEVVAPTLLEDGQLPEEQVAVYADCGWEYVSGSGYIHVFRAPAESPAPEFYLDPAQQAETLQCLCKEHLRAGFVPVLEIVLMSLLFSAISGLTTGHLAAQLFQLWVDNGFLVLGLLLALLVPLYDHVRGALSLHRLYRQMKQGAPLNHAPKKRSLFPRLFSWGLTLLAVVCIGYDFSMHRAQPLPTNAPDAPYVLLTEMGVDGTRGRNPVSGKEASLTHQYSFAAESWHTQEFMDYTQFSYQDVYLLNPGTQPETLVHALMMNSTFAQDPALFTAVDVPGLDLAWVSSHAECIAVRGNKVAYIIISRYSPEELQAVLTDVAAKWNA